MVLPGALQLRDVGGDGAQGYTAVSEYDADRDKLRIYVATVSTVGADVMVAIVAEAIVYVVIVTVLSDRVSLSWHYIIS
jgi:hypothetical protein